MICSSKLPFASDRLCILVSGLLGAFVTAFKLRRTHRGLGLNSRELMRGRMEMVEMDSHGGLEVTIRQTEWKKTTTQQLRGRDLVMSINRTRWLDKLRPAGASSGGWIEGPMAPVETIDAATVDQRCPFKHRTGWRHNHSNSKLCVALRMGQANLLSITNCHLCAGAMLSSRSIFQATRFVRVILEQGAMSSSQEKKDLICACHPCASHTSVSFKKNTPLRS